MALFARVLHDAFGGVIGDWQQILALLSVLSMFLGAVAAIGQTNIKRLMAYSSIAHMGYALIGLAAGTAQGVQAMLSLYGGLCHDEPIGTFAFILSMEKDGRPVTDMIASLNLYANACADQGDCNVGSVVQPGRCTAVSWASLPSLVCGSAAY